jgi:hypothetical protein
VHVHNGINELSQALQFGVTTVLDIFNEPDKIRGPKKIVLERSDMSGVRSALHGATIKGWVAGSGCAGYCGGGGGA